MKGKGSDALMLLLDEKLASKMKGKKGKKREEEDSDYKSDDSSSQEGEDKLAAAEEAMEAIESGDVESFSDALESFILACQEY